MMTRFQVYQRNKVKQKFSRQWGPDFWVSLWRLRSFLNLQAPKHIICDFKPDYVGKWAASEKLLGAVYMSC